ncbi:MFS transporter [Bradyrhizobium mercantei]|uniref:MFS transporter n=1 Tax=Bradyrhizobium mercantei TaxID=1904807 RepID=UPI001FD8AFD4|nr:MFS transporter [Bradyrhizobium mercantei]
MAKSARILDETLAASSVFVDRRDAGVEGASLLALFVAALRRTTTALWVAFFFCLLPVYVLYAWAPTLLTGKGFDVPTASFALALFNFGGVAGCIVTGWAIGRFGTRAPILTVAGAATAGAAVLAWVPVSIETKPLIMFLLCIEGFFLLGAQGSLYALAAYVYPTSARSTGVGAAAGFGRGGDRQCLRRRVRAQLRCNNVLRRHRRLRRHHLRRGSDRRRTSGRDPGRAFALRRLTGYRQAIIEARGLPRSRLRSSSTTGRADAAGHDGAE